MVYELMQMLFPLQISVNLNDLFFFVKDLNLEIVFKNTTVHQNSALIQPSKS